MIADVIEVEQSHQEKYDNQRKKQFGKKKHVKFNSNQQSSNTRIIPSRYDDAKYPQIFDKLIAELSIMLPEGEMKDLCKHFSKLKQLNEHNFQQQLFDKELRNTVEQSLQKVIQDIQKKTQNIYKLENQIEQMAGQCEKLNEQNQKYHKYIKDSKDTENRWQKLAQQRPKLQKIIQQTKQKIHNAGTQNYKYYGRVYQQLKQLPNYEDLQKQVHRLKSQEQAVNQKKNHQVRTMNQLRNQIQKFKLHVEKYQNILSYDMSQVLTNTSNNYQNHKNERKKSSDQDSQSEGQSISMLKIGQNNRTRQIKWGKKLYNYQQPKRNTYCDLLLFLFGIILIICLWKKHSEPVEPEI